MRGRDNGGLRGLAGVKYGEMEVYACMHSSDLSPWANK